MNVKLLRSVKRAILAEPAQFIMGMFFSSQGWVGMGDLDRKIPHCGTAACICGWALAISQNKSPKAAREADTYFAHTEALGRGAIGLRGGQARRLFHLRHWPATYKKRWYATASLVDRAKIAAARIERFIRTKGAE